jgi:predicted nucleic acid-binding protein
LPVFDTNILIDHLRGVDLARNEIRAVASPRISIITWMEVMCGAEDAAEAAALRTFLAGFHVVQLTTEIAERAVLLRSRRRLRLPDAIILATALADGTFLITRNTRDFAPGDPAVRVPYALGSGPP